MSLPYDMGNSGDLLKHGVLAEFVRWRCDQGGSFRFIDLFGGELCNQPASGDGEAKRARMVAKRVRSLLPKNIALRTAQTGIERDCYYSSGLLVKKRWPRRQEREMCACSSTILAKRAARNSRNLIFGPPCAAAPAPSCA